MRTVWDIILFVHMNTTRSEYAMLSGPPPLHCVVVMPVGEASIVTAVSSAHQMEPFVACEHLLQQVKLNVPILEEWCAREWGATVEGQSPASKLGTLPPVCYYSRPSDNG